MSMRKTFLVTVDVNSQIDCLEDGAESLIAKALTRTPYLYNPDVTLAPDSFQPINNDDKPRPGVFYYGSPSGVPNVQFVDAVSPHPDNNEGNPQA